MNPLSMLSENSTSFEGFMRAEASRRRFAVSSSPSLEFWVFISGEHSCEQSTFEDSRTLRAFRAIDLAASSVTDAISVDPMEKAWGGRDSRPFLDEELGREESP